MKILLEFKKEDLWIGAFWKRMPNRLDIWICLIPCFPIHIIKLKKEEKDERPLMHWEIRIDSDYCVYRTFRFNTKNAQHDVICSLLRGLVLDDLCCEKRCPKKKKEVKNS